MQSLSTIVRTAHVFDYGTGNAHAYPDLYAEKTTKAKSPRGARMRDYYAPHERGYLIIWDHGVVAYLRLPKAPWQITSDDIEKAYASAPRLKLTEAR